jgi:hypothetical protein
MDAAGMDILLAARPERLGSLFASRLATNLEQIPQPLNRHPSESWDLTAFHPTEKKRDSSFRWNDAE